MSHKEQMVDTLSSAALRAYFDENMPEFLALLRRMVEINSFTANPMGVNELGQATAVAFATLGFTAETVQSENPLHGKHLVLTRLGAYRDAPRIGLISHLDTVFPPDEELRNEFAWREDGDRIYGPGVIDIKGGTLMIYMVLAAIQRFAPELYDTVTWVVLLDANEETGGMDFGRVCVNRLGEKAVAALIFEPGQWHGDTFPLVASRKGMAVFRIEVEGKGAHAGSSHEKGANAIVQMAEVIRRVHALTNYDDQITFNVGTVAGGSVINRVPHFASASVEMRTFDPAVYEAGVEAMLALNELKSVSTAVGNYACNVRVWVLNRIAPWPRNPGTERLMRVWQTTAESINLQVTPEDRGGLSDGNFFWGQIPTLDGLGPTGANAHCSERSADGTKDQEYVLVDSFTPKATLNTLAIVWLLRDALREEEDEER